MLLCRYFCLAQMLLLTSWGTDVKVQQCSFSFPFWERKQNFVPNMWQVVFANIFVKGRVINSDVNDFFDGCGHFMTLPSYNLDIFHWCCVASSIVMFKYWWWCLLAFFISFFKGSGWFPIEFIITFSPATFVPIYDVALFLIPSLSFGNISKFLSVFPPLGYAWMPYLL